MTFPLIVAAEGFGFNLNVFETNILNLAVVILAFISFFLTF